MRAILPLTLTVVALTQGGWAAEPAAPTEDSAMAARREVVRRAPKSPDGWVKLAEGWMERGRPDEAATAYRRAVELAPKHVGWLAALSEAELGARHFSEALAAAEKAVAAAPGEAGGWVAKARALAAPEEFFRGAGRCHESHEPQRRTGLGLGRKRRRASRAGSCGRGDSGLPVGSAAGGWKSTPVAGSGRRFSEDGRFFPGRVGLPARAGHDAGRRSGPRCAGGCAGAGRQGQRGAQLLEEGVVVRPESAWHGRAWERSPLPSGSRTAAKRRWKRRSGSTRKTPWPGITEG